MYDERHRVDGQMRDDSVYAQMRKMMQMLEEIQVQLRFIRSKIGKEDV